MNEREFFKQFPKTTSGEFACFADCSNGEPCVWDDNRPEDCAIASKGIKKLDCKEWKKAPDYDNCYSPTEIWEWVSPKIGSLTAENQKLKEELQNLKRENEANFKAWRDK